MTTPAFLTKKGNLTAYALSCGYIEVAGYKTGERVVILSALQYDKLIYCISHFKGGNEIEFTYYRLLSEARKAYRKIVFMKNLDILTHKKH
jgi:hypothetical protein